MEMRDSRVSHLPPVAVHLLHLLPRPASVMDLTAEEKQGRAFLGLHVVLAFCQPMTMPVLTGDEKWIDVEGAGLLPEVQEGREWSSGLAKEEQGMG